MGPFEAVVVFVISWWLLFLPMLSAGTKSQLNAGEIVPGSEPGAPTRTAIRRKALYAAGGAAAITLTLWALIITGALSFLLPQSSR